MTEIEQEKFRKLKRKIQEIASLVPKGMIDLAETQLEKIVPFISHLKTDYQLILKIDIDVIKARIAAQQGEINQSVRKLADLLDLTESINYKAGISSILNTLGRIQWELGEDLELAYEYFQEALSIREEIQDEEGITESLNGLGIIESARGAFEEALKYFEAYKSRSQEAGDFAGKGNALNNIAEVYRLKGELIKAKITYLEALECYNRAHDYDGEALVYLNLGWTTWAEGDLSTAISYFKNSLELRKQIKSRWVSYMSNLVALAGALTDQAKITSQDYTESEELLNQALNYAYSYNHPSSIIVCRFFQAYLEQAKGNLARAEELYLECFEKAKGTNFEYMSKSLLEIAEILLARYLMSFDQMFLTEFMKRINEALTLAREHKLLVILCEIHVLIGLFEASKNNFNNALAYLTQAIILAEENNLPREKNRAIKEFHRILTKDRHLKIKTGTFRDQDALVYVQNYLEDVTEILKRRKEL